MILLMMEVAQTAFWALRESCLRYGYVENRMSIAAGRRGRKSPTFLSKIIFYEDSSTHSRFKFKYSHLLKLLCWHLIPNDDNNNLK
jgi:hypothetical protein